MPHGPPPPSYPPDTCPPHLIHQPSSPCHHHCCRSAVMEEGCWKWSGAVWLCWPVGARVERRHIHNGSRGRSRGGDRLGVRSAFGSWGPGMEVVFDFENKIPHSHPNHGTSSSPPQ